MQQGNFDKTLQQIAESAMTDSVVRLDVERETSLEALRPEFDISEIKTSCASGFFVEKYLIVTNFHVVAGAASVNAQLAGTEETYQIEGVTAFDIQNDLALLKVTNQGSPLTLGNSNKVRKGNHVCAVGYPRGVKKIAHGTIQGIRRRDNRIQMKIDISTGNSGSPILNSEGEVVGVQASSDDSHSYSIPSKTLKLLIKGAGEVEAFEVWQERPYVCAYTEAKQGDEKREQGAYKAAIAHYDAALKLNPDMADVYEHRAAAKMELANFGDYADVMVDFYLSFRHRPLQFKLSHLSTFVIVFFFKTLIQFLKTVFGRRGWLIVQGVAHVREAKSAVDENDKGQAKNLYQAAINNFTDAIKLRPKKAKAYNHRGWTKYLLGHLESEIGNVGEAQERYQEAVSDINAALRLKPKGKRLEAACFHVRGAAKAGLGDHNDAIEDFNACIRLRPKKALYYHDRGLSKEALAQHEAAKADFAKAKAIDPDVGK